MSDEGVVRSIVVFLVAATLLLICDLMLKEGIWREILFEIGIAFLVSLIIWSVFELYRAEVAESEWNKRMEAATKNVFYAVLRKELPTQLINTAQKLAFNNPLIRSEFSVKYTLWDRNYVENGQRVDFVLMEAEVSFCMKNVGLDPADFRPALGLPDPVHPRLKEQVTVQKMEVRRSPSGVPEEINFAVAHDRFVSLRDSPSGTEASGTEIPFAADTVRVKSMESIFVSARYTMAKSPEDAELLQTGAPSDGLRVVVVVGDKSSRNLEIFARAVHPEPLERATDTDGSILLEIKGYLVPHQGVLVWWKESENATEKGV
jgi:hypothetical protein